MSQKPEPTPAYPRAKRSLLARTAAYAWASPTTALGLVVGGVTLLSRGHVRQVAGVLEFHGGFCQWVLDRTPVRASAMTLGHVILGQDAERLERYRRHEHIHVRQAELWGIAFIPVYLISSLNAWLRGDNAYLGNRFEQEAFLEADGIDLVKMGLTRQRMSEPIPAPDHPESPPDHRASADSS